MPVAEKKLEQLPTGPLYWRVESFPTIEQARAAEGPTSLSAEVAGSAWLLTLGPQGGAAAGAREIADIGPLPPLKAAEYLLRINAASGRPGAKTPVHTHPGSETFFVLSGRLGQREPHGSVHLEAGQSMAGRAPGVPMEVSSEGKTDLNAIVMFVVDATKPFSSPAQFQ